MTTVRQPNQPPDVRTPESPLGHEGVAFVATLRGTPGRDVLDTALSALENLHHGTSRSSGILTHIPHAMLRSQYGADLPSAGRYALGFVFHVDARAEQELITQVAAEEGFAVFAWREVPINDTIVDLGPRRIMPEMRQVILTPLEQADRYVIDARLYRIRRRVEGASGAYFASLSRSTIVYKGLLPATRLAEFYEDLADPQYRTEIAVLHSGQSTQYTTWCKAQPHRILAHDGRIHSETANHTWLRARMSLMDSDLLNGIDSGLSRDHLTEGVLDELVELLHRSGRRLTHALRLLFPEQWGRKMSRAERDFCSYASLVMEPWEGSGVTCFADGDLVGAVLDRHGTRSGRYWVTETGLVVFASETGVVDLDPSIITKKGRLAPGEIIAVDTVVGNVIPSDAVRAQLAAQHPYGTWLEDHLVELASPRGARPDLPTEIDPAYPIKSASLRAIENLPETPDYGTDPVTSRKLTFFDRFRSSRSQLTSPYIDAVAMPDSPGVYLGPEANVLVDGPEHTRKVMLPGPAISTALSGEISTHLNLYGITGIYPSDNAQSAGEALRAVLEGVRAEVDAAIAAGAEVIRLSNRGARFGHTAPVPSLLLAGVAHQHLLEGGDRAKVSLVVEAGDAVEPADVIRLLEAGAEAVVPYHGEVVAGASGARRFLAELNERVYEGLLNSGVAVYGAYQGSRRFHIVGLQAALVEEFFTGAARALGAFGLEEIGELLAKERVTLTPLHLLLTPVRATPVDVDEVDTVEQISRWMAPRDLLIITNTRQGVTLGRLATAKELLLAPPAHQDTVIPDGLRLVINELRMVNPTSRIHVRVGADLRSDIAATEAVNAGADVINLVDGEYEWVFGLLSLRQSELLEQVPIAVGTPLRTAQDVFIAAALGAQEFRLADDVEQTRVAHEVRHLLAQAGLRSIEDLVGRVDLLDWREAVTQWGNAGVDLTGAGRRSHQYPLTRDHTHHSGTFDDGLIDLINDALEDGTPARINTYVSNTDVSVGARIAGEMIRTHGLDGLASGAVRLTLTGSSGTALGAYLAPGITIIVQGEAGDFVGKGLAGGRVIVRPENTAGFSSQENVIAGSGIGYGATGGGIYLAGEVGERLGAHNWGATIVAEGAGDAAGYRMHAGTLVILGQVGDNLGVGMEGGAIYALDLPPNSRESNGTNRAITFSTPDEADLHELTAIIAEHVEGTRSRIGTLLLADPDSLRERFIKIHIPTGARQKNSPEAPTRTGWGHGVEAIETNQEEKA